MTRIVLDAQAPEKLASAQGVVEICDVQGRVLGMYAAGLELRSLLRLEPQVSEEELNRRARESKYISTDELLANLKDELDV